MRQRLLNLSFVALIAIGLLTIVVERPGAQLTPGGTPSNQAALPSCDEGEVLSYQSGNWTCSDGTIGSATCSAGQVPYTADGSAWTCQDFVPWTTYAFNAATFDAFGATTWTVEDADESVKYMILGKTLWVAFDIMTTSVSDGNAAWLMITLPASKTAAVASYTVVWTTDAGAASAVGNASTGVGDTHIYIAKFGAGGNWSTATNTTGVRGTVILEIQ